MADIEILKKYRKEQFEKTKKVLEHAYTITAFIHTYGPLCDSTYFSLILNFNNVIERYLRNGDSKTILQVYAIYAEGKLQNKKETEIFKEIRQELYKLPVYMVTSINERQARRV